MADDAASSSASDTGTKIVREWIDVVAKSLIALAGVLLAYVANGYQQKASVVSLMNQRETAESNLRSAMMGQLIGPFVGSVRGDKPIDPDAARLLLEVLALNFHTHFELKPLFLKVDTDLRQAGRESSREELEGVARRLVDRQVAMLQAASPVEPRPRLRRVLLSSSGASSADLFFVRVPVFQSPQPVLREAGGEDVPDANTNARPAVYGGFGGQLVCSVSPDRQYALAVRVTAYDPALGTANVSWSATDDVDRCAPGRAVESGWPPSKNFTLSHYDFPLTDNAVIDPSHRFALNLYNNDENGPGSLTLKLVWFPVGYITERERPMNFYEVNRVLGKE